MASPRLAALLDLAALLAPKAQTTIAGDVALAFERPEAYVRAHADRLSDRGIDKPILQLAWIALVDALIDARALVEIDWRASATDVATALDQLAGFPAADAAWLRNNPALDGLDTGELLQRFGRRLLRRRKRQLAALDIQSDCYCLVAVPAGKAASLAQLAEAAAYGNATLFDGRTGAAAERRR